MKRIWIVVCVLAVLVVLAMASLASADWYVTGPCGHTIQIGPPIHWHATAPVIYDSAPVYVEPMYWHPGHWSHMYDAYGNRYDRWVPGHWSIQPYRWR